MTTTLGIDPHSSFIKHSCSLNRDQVRSLDFAVKSCFRKIFCVRSQTVIEGCKTLPNCPPISETIITRKYKFLHDHIYLDTELYKRFNDTAITDFSISNTIAVLCCHWRVLTFRVSRRHREMYCGHARLSVRGRMRTLLHAGCNLGKW